MNENSVPLGRWNDPALIARIKARQERARRNRDWLDAQLAELLPQARAVPAGEWHVPCGHREG
jgi:hypothetical protein